MEEATNPVIANIRAEWDWVRPGIEEVLHLDVNADYRPEDVYASCVMGESHLWVHPEGFVVTTSEINKYTGERSLLIWIAHAKQRGGSVATDYTAFFEDVARNTGHSHIQTITPHEPLADYLIATAGWQKQHIILGKDLRG